MVRYSIFLFRVTFVKSKCFFFAAVHFSFHAFSFLFPQVVWAFLFFGFFFHGLGITKNVENHFWSKMPAREQIGFQNPYCKSSFFLISYVPSMKWKSTFSNLSFSCPRSSKSRESSVICLGRLTHVWWTPEWKSYLKSEIKISPWD